MLTPANLKCLNFAQGSSLLDGGDAVTQSLPHASYENPAVDRLLLQANSTLNPIDHLNALKQVSQIIADDVPVIPLYTNQNQWIMDRAYIVPEDTLVSGLGVYLWKVHL
jgi:ABC-type oligopeptide transport system substrate-binding subunit